MEHYKRTGTGGRGDNVEEMEKGQEMEMGIGE